MNNSDNVVVRYWMSGSAVAFFGAVLARVVAPSPAGRTMVVISTTGQLLVLSGLIILALGVRHRVRSTGVSPEQDSAL